MSIAELHHLQVITLGTNYNLTADLSILLEGSWMAIEIMDLSENRFHGEIPMAIGNRTSLVELDMAGNSIRGRIPKTIGNLCGLSKLNLYGNMIEQIPERLNGTLPTTFGQLSKLTYLDVSMNSLTGIVSESHFEKLFELKTLMLSSNSLIFNKQNLTWFLDLSNATISDTIPNWFWDIASHIEHLNFSNNYIHGQLPRRLLISGLVDLSSNHIQGPFPLPVNEVQQLDLSNNHLIGPIPENITHVLQFASLLLVSGNQINGTIPSAIGEMKNLRVLDLSRNNLHGSIPPTLGGCTQMEALDLSGNHLSGPIPESIGLLTQLRTLHLNENNLSQELPSSMKNCSSLETLDLGENTFSGCIPTWIGKSFPSLRILRLRSNTFSGEIPLQISNLTSLQVLDLANNHLTGLIPSSIGNLTAMQTPQKQSRLLAYGVYYNERIYIISYVERLLVSMQDKMFEYSKTLSLVTSMDLSSNRLIGEIPDSLMNLSGMLILNLSNNRLGGHIPDRIGNLQQLMTFDISRNRLSGLIPSSMVSITFLNDVNFSSNNFSGRIPSGNQFSTFEAYVYNGNPDLCGPPILRECNERLPPGRSEPTDGGDGSEIPWYYVSVGLRFWSGILGSSCCSVS
ncbi:receptor-like protein EIX2 [Magnolia sinica]|uniref:receptor-like protein EIX2 n=1 Tax=Magnolia sinica TaxID=86752 RepID=UPI002659507F|nr:receptor-like protein EIX2 [Magnolia sinica]